MSQINRSVNFLFYLKKQNVTYKLRNLYVTFCFFINHLELCHE